jgi:FkbM family methyltransferase
VSKPAPALDNAHLGAQAGPGVSGAPAASDPATFRRIALALSAAAEEFAKTSNAEDLQRLQALRGQAAESLLALGQPAGPALAESLNAIAGSCLKSGMRSFPRSVPEEDLFVRSQKALASATEGKAAAPAFAAVLMAWHAFELEALPPLAAIPKELRPVWLSFLLEIPPAFVRFGDGDRFAHYLERLCEHLLRHLRGTTESVGDIAAAFFSSAIFTQSYFNELNLRSLMRARAAIIEDLVGRSGAVLDQLRVATPRKRRPRIGFISLSVADGTETALLAAYLERLNRNRFDVRLYSVGAPAGKMGALCRAAAETYVQLPAAVPAAVARLRRENLDIALFCTNLTAGLHILTQVAAHRVAPVQVATGASPVTTGLRSMDVMLSGAPNETENSPDHYTERLVLLPGPANCYSFKLMLEGLVPPGPVARSAHGIPDDAVLFFSAANFYKILPELSEQWFRILAQVPNSYLMLMPFNPNWAADYPVVSFNARLRAQAAAAGVTTDRLRLHPPVPTIAHLHRVMEIADVYLDAFPFSGACSLYDALAVGLPIVARCGAVCRSRHSKAILDEAGLGDWVVSDGASYVERAVELGRDAARRTAERERVERIRHSGLKLIDTARFAAMLMPALDGMLSDWEKRVEALRAPDPAALAQRVAALVPDVAEELGPFSDRDLVLQVVLPYLRNGSSRRMIDVGACVGALSSPFLAEGWQTVMFEPDQRCHPTLGALAEAHPGQVRIENAAVTADRDGNVPFHIAAAPGLSGMSRSPFAADLTTLNVRALALAPYIVRNGLFDVDFVKIDAEGHDLAILDGVDLGRIAPRLIMVEFGDQFAGQDRAAIEAVIDRMQSRAYRACVVCLRPLGEFARQQWETSLLAIAIDAVPALPAGAPMFGNILFFRKDDGDFLPSLCDWLDQFGDRKHRGLSPLR